MELKPGYKRSEVGVIPVEWDVASIRQFSTCFSGGTPSTSNALYYGGDIPWITSTDLNRRRVSEVAGRITDDGLANSAAKFVTEGTLLVALYGATAGVCAISEIRAAINQAVLAIVPHGVITEFLFQTFTLRKDHFITAYAQGGQPNLSGEIVKSFLIPIPPPPEQHVIAAALSDVDALLGGLDRLIAKKRDLKQAALQQLLTGQTRLPGFHGEWEMGRLGEALTICHGKNQREVAVADGPFPILGTGGQIGTASRPLFHEPSVLIGRKGTINQPQYMETPFWTVDTLFYCSMRDGNDAKFFYYRFCLINWMQFNEASGVPSLNARTIEKIEIPCPQPEEQVAIAAVLSDMDAELAALEARRDKTRDLKQAMMQELLTGKTRLVAVGYAHA